MQVGCKTVQLLGKTVWWFLKKLKNRMIIGSNDSLLRTDPKELKAGTSTGICAAIFIGILLTIVKR